MATPTSTPNLNQITQELYDTDLGDTSMDVSAGTRKFQNSIVLKQDSTKEGVLSFLKDWNESRPLPSTDQPAQTMRPTRRQGGY